MPSRALNGLAAAAVAVGVTQLIAVPFGAGADSRTAVGSAVIDLTPGPVKEWAIQTFGTADKLFLSVAMLAVIAVIAAVARRWETRRRPIGSARSRWPVSPAARRCCRGRAVARRHRAHGRRHGVCGVAVLRISRRVENALRSRIRLGAESIRRRLSLITLALLVVGAVAGVSAGVVSRRLNSVAGDRNARSAPPAVTTAPPIPPTCSRKALRCRSSSPATTTSTGSTPR